MGASFRMSKHDLRARPAFHHTRDATWAHLTVVITALAVVRYLQDATGISIAKIVRELCGLQEVTTNPNGHQITAAGPLPPKKTEEFLTTLNIPTGHQKSATQATPQHPQAERRSWAASRSGKPLSTIVFLVPPPLFFRFLVVRVHRIRTT